MRTFTNTAFVTAETSYNFFIPPNLDRSVIPSPFAPRPLLFHKLVLAGHLLNVYGESFREHGSLRVFFGRWESDLVEVRSNTHLVTRLPSGAAKVRAAREENIVDDSMEVVFARSDGVL
ncbi:hypothetical protein M427DRAFT_152515, partial [Gonapodya prolifera JEL478]